MVTSNSPSSPTRLIGFAFGLLATAVFIVFELRYLLVLFAGVLFGVLLHAGASWLGRHGRMPHPVALTLLLLVGVATVTLGLVAVAPTFLEQLEELRRQMPHVVSRLQDRLMHLPFVSRPMIAEAGAALGGERTTGPHVPPFGALMSALGSSMEVVAGMVVVFFLGVYGAAQPRAYRRSVLALTPRALEERMEHALDASSRNLARWLIGRLIAMAFVGVTTTIAFHLLGVPMALALGVLAGLLTFIEYAGAVLSGIPPVLIALAQSPAQAFWVLVLFTALHVVEGYVLTPLLARATVSLPPAITLACQVLLGALAGPLGLTLSTPLLVVGVCAAQSFRRNASEDQPERRQAWSVIGVHSRAEPAASQREQYGQ